MFDKEVKPSFFFVPADKLRDEMFKVDANANVARGT